LCSVCFDLHISCAMWVLTGTQCEERIMIFKAFLTLPLVGLLAACGGSSTSSTPPASSTPTASFTTLRAFSDGAGVGRGVSSDGIETVFIAPDIAEVVAVANQTANSPVDDIQFSDFQVTRTLPTAVVREGAITIEGNVANVIIVEDNGGEAGLIYVVFPGVADAVFATGSAFGTAPNGAFTYNGVHIIGERGLGGAEDGSFTLTADFNSRTFNYSGATASSSLTGTGQIDTVNGRFASSNLSSNVLGSTNTASMYGQLHGNSAQSVSGVFHTNESDPRYGGAFVGSRP
jgi:hypothetical protein